jgi:hypothetical protein
MSDTTPSSSIYYTSGSTATIITNYTSSITDPSGVVVENNTDYSTGQFTNSFNPNATFTLTGNQDSGSLCVYSAVGSCRRWLQFFRMLKEHA